MKCIWTEGWECILFFNSELFLNDDVCCKQGVFFHYYGTPGSLTRVSTSVPDHIDQEAKKEQCVLGSGTEQCTGLPALFIHPCWQPRLLFTLCSVHMASGHITKAEITFWSMTLQQLPQHTKAPWWMQTPTLQHHGQLSSRPAASVMALFIDLWLSPRFFFVCFIASLSILHLRLMQLFADVAQRRTCTRDKNHPQPSPEPYLTIKAVSSLLHNLVSTFPEFPCVLIILPL